jgi:enoyl-CoA hydratase
MTPSLVVDQPAEGVLRMQLNRPGTRNAVDLALARLMSEALDRLEADDALRVGVITAAGPVFCAGMDLKAFGRGELPVVGGGASLASWRSPR